MTTEEAILRLRADPEHAERMKESYLLDDPATSARRFAASSEFAEVRRIVGPARLASARVLDLGAGTGVASHAFAAAGARVVALEPDPSAVVGQGAVRAACGGLPVRIASGVGERLPFRDRAFDVVYARQVLHHAQDLAAVVAECARVLAPGGILLACREHVADDARQLREFLAAHPVHALAGGEHAYALREYRAALRAAAFSRVRILGPWDTVINAFPAVRSEVERIALPGRLLEARLGWIGRWAARVPGVPSAIRWRLDRPIGGRLYSFVATKEGA
jgi:SAM-dependent methyltransferase